MVECDGLDEDTVENPVIIFEILSPSTERKDRAEKMLNYQAISSMRVYGLVDQFREAVTIYRRDQAGLWKMEFYSEPTETVELPEIECRVTVAEIYERVF